jgi:hypothetical protein
MQNEVKKQLQNRFEMKDLGDCKFVLGIELVENSNAVVLSQKRYICDVLKRFQMENCNAVSTPMDCGLVLSEDNCPKTDEEIREMKNIPYRQAIGSLIHLAIASRPDIAFAVGMVSRFMHNPGKLHWSAVKRIFRYLQGTKNYGIGFEKCKVAEFKCYSDADWAGDKDDRKSTSGYLFLLAGGPISWGSKKQNSVALSTSEAEYIALSLAIQEGKWIQGLINELFAEIMEKKFDLVVFEDNQSCIKMTKNPVNHGRAKHIDIKYHFIRDEIKKNSVFVEYAETKVMLADILTKALPGPRHAELCEKFGLKEVNIEGEC